MAVLPEEMDRLDVEDTTGSLRKIEEYIHYMTERIEFGMRNMTKTVTASGVSTTEVYILMVAMDNRLSALESTVNGIRGSLTSVSGQVTDLEGKANDLDTALQGLTGNVATLAKDQGSLAGALAALTDRVTALENAQTPQTPETEP